MTSNLESLDTNILLRIILNDIPEQRSKALTLLCKPNTIFYVDDHAISEVVFILEKQCRYCRNFIVDILPKAIFSVPNIQSDKHLLSQILPFYLHHPKLSWNDCYLAAKAAKKQAEPLWTFDHKFALQSPTAKLVN